MELGNGIYLVKVFLEDFGGEVLQLSKDSIAFINERLEKLGFSDLKRVNSSSYLDKQDAEKLEKEVLQISFDYPNPIFCIYFVDRNETSVLKTRIRKGEIVTINQLDWVQTFPKTTASNENFNLTDSFEIMKILIKHFKN